MRAKEFTKTIKPFCWSDYEGLRMEDRFKIVETYFSKSKNLFESNSPSESEYFRSLFSMSDQMSDKECIIIYLGLVNNNIVQLQTPEIGKILKKIGNVYTIQLSDGKITEFPNHLSEKLYTNLFFFDNLKSYDKFRNIMVIKYEFELPNTKDIIGYTKGIIPYSPNLDEAPLPPDWDPEQLNLRQTFKNRLKYALDRAKRIGGGSSRVAMTIDYEGRPTALKVAKNAKGLAQNEAEIEILKDNYSGKLPIVIPLIDYDKANKRPVWLQTEIAKKIQAPTLMKLLHTPALWLLINQVRNIIGQRKPHDMDDEKIKKYYFNKADKTNWNPTEEDYNMFRQYANELAELASSSTLDLGDLQSPANWGVYNGRPVVIDLGFTEAVAPLYGYNRK